MKDARASLQALNSEKKQLLEDADDLMARKASLEVSLSDLDARVEEEGSTKEKSLEVLDKLEDTIKDMQAELDDVLPQFQSRKDEEEKLNLR